MIFYKKEHLSCISYKTDESDGFKHVKVAEGGTIEFYSTKGHSLVFLMKGSVYFQIEDEIKKLVSKELLLIPKGCPYTYEVRQDSELIVFSFRTLRSVCDKLFIQRMLDREDVYDPLSAIPFRHPLENFLDTMAFYLDAGLNCEHLHEIKEKELFLVLRAFYTRRELTRLFHEILGESDFRSLIMQNYMKVRGIGELASLANMGRTTFDSKFKSVFGTSARQWILNQMARQVKLKAMDPDVTISDLMTEFNFNSATHFNWFCRKQFDCTPLELIRNCQRSVMEKSGRKMHGKKSK
ncbi:MAG: helix-turn-helix domain-containing protein [Tannerella sp.]|jgi:AraC-like DNA-binding protein|nr:helix-turn-helix domain-containing protein [Tannerella sp.]